VVGRLSGSGTITAPLGGKASISHFQALQQVTQSAGSSLLPPRRRRAHRMPASGTAGASAPRMAGAARGRPPAHSGMCKRAHRPLQVPSPRYEALTHVALWPQTGRTHQLRRHCALIGHPILVGDGVPGARRPAPTHLPAAGPA
jgi:hypothetical protein